jgi:hypothetical protein
VKSSLDYSIAAGFLDATNRISPIRVPKPDAKDGIDISTLIASLDVMYRAFYDEMAKRHFLVVAPDRVGFLEPLPEMSPFNLQHETGYQAHIFWGNGSKCSIHAAIPDIKAAGNCLAAECHTAAVFHAMRAAEYAVRELAKRVRVPLTLNGKPRPIEFATWEEIIKEIKKRLAATSNTIRSQKRQEQLARHSDLADRCEYMKHLWRNNVMHTRAHFNRLEAAGILQRVREFIQAVEKK